MELFQEWREAAPAASRWYLNTVAMPGVAVFARLVPLAEVAAGTALICEFRVRLAAALTFVMVTNFHFASDVLFHYSYLINPYGLPVMGGLLALRSAAGGCRSALTELTRNNCLDGQAACPLTTRLSWAAEIRISASTN